MGTKVTIVDALDGFGYGISLILLVEFEFRAVEV